MSGSTSRSTAVKKWPVLRCRLMAGSGCPPRNVTTYGESFGKSELSLAEAVPFLSAAR